MQAFALLAALCLSVSADVLPTGFATFFAGNACPEGFVAFPLAYLPTEAREALLQKSPDICLHHESHVIGISCVCCDVLVRS